METSAHKVYGNETGATYNNDKTGITSLAGEFVNNITGATKSAEINSAEAAKQRNYDYYMRQHGYKIDVESMKEAGLNPAMMYGGAGENSAHGVSASSSGAGAGVISGIASLFNSASNLLNSNDNTKNKSVRNNIYISAEKAIKNIGKYLN